MGNNIFSNLSDNNILNIQEKEDLVLETNKLKANPQSTSSQNTTAKEISAKKNNNHKVKIEKDHLDNIVQTFVISRNNSSKKNKI